MREKHVKKSDSYPDCKVERTRHSWHSFNGVTKKITSNVQPLEIPKEKKPQTE